MKNKSQNSSAKKQVKSSKETKRQRIDLSGCKLVAPYGLDPHAPESLSAIVTKAGKPGLRSVARKA